ncbi:MAG: LptF/LptG family permease, partial [Pseudomonadota bacterium]
IALLSVPLAVSRKRSSGWQRIAVAAVILAIYDNGIKLVASSADLGRVDPALGLWGLCAVFMLVGLWLYFKTAGQGSASPFRSVYRALSRVAPDAPPPAPRGRAPGRAVS